MIDPLFEFPFEVLSSFSDDDRACESLGVCVRRTVLPRVVGVFACVERALFGVLFDVDATAIFLLVVLLIFVEFSFSPE